MDTECIIGKKVDSVIFLVPMGSAEKGMDTGSDEFCCTSSLWYANST